MSETNPDLKRPGIGDFVRCNFPHMSDDPSEPSEHEHCALIVNIEHDDELNVPIYTMVHSSKEIERLAKTGGKIRPGSFKLLVQAITGRVPVSDFSDRIVNYEQVVLLPAVKEFFGDLEKGPIIVIDSISEDAVEKIRAKMKKPPNPTALVMYRIERDNPEVPQYYLVRERIAHENDPA